MTPPRSGNPPSRRADRQTLAAAGVFAAALAVFWLSPVHQVFDAKFSLLVSESLARGDGFSVGEFLPTMARTRCDPSTALPYQLICIDGRVHHAFPAGGPVLAVPFVLAGRTLGLRALDERGNWSRDAERRLQRHIAGLLVALYTVLLFETAVAVLPLGPALAVTFAAAAGSQVWSTASRALWSHTWVLVLCGAAVLELVRAEREAREPRGVLLATLLGWAFFARPTAAIAIAAVALWLLRHRTRGWIAYAATSGAWLALLVAWSRSTWGTALPPYYDAGRLSLDGFAEALAGNLVSPGRGLLVYLPHLFFVGYLLVRYPPRELRALAALSAGSAIALLVVTSSFPHWWGGHCFGPRLLTDAVPWLALIAIVAVRGRLDARSRDGDGRASRWEQRAAALLVGVAVVMHAGGALSEMSNLWNMSPRNVDEAPQRLWDWSDPQFLAFAIERRVVAEAEDEI